jgi:hypothetical protein
MMDQYRQTLGVTNDDEWAIIQPLIQKVLDARQQAGYGGGRGGRGGGRGGFGGGAVAQTDAEAGLQKAIDDRSPAAVVKAAIKKVRDEHKAKQALLEEAQDKLRAVLTVKQEAQIVLMGILP